MSSDRERARKLFAGVKEGMYAKEAAPLLKMTVNSCSKMLCNLVVAGSLKRLIEGTQDSPRRARYYDPAHEDYAIKFSRSCMGKTWARGKSDRKRHKDDAMSYSDRKAMAEGKITSKTKLVVAPKVFGRYTGDGAAPIFSGLGVGRYLDSDAPAWVKAVCNG